MEWINYIFCIITKGDLIKKKTPTIHFSEVGRKFLDTPKEDSHLILKCKSFGRNFLAPFQKLTNLTHDLRTHPNLVNGVIQIPNLATSTVPPRK